jgi:hypothetical protein
MPFLNAKLLSAMVSAAGEWDAVIPALAAEVSAADVKRHRRRPGHAPAARRISPNMSAGDTGRRRDDHRLNAFLPDVGALLLRG